MASFIPDSLTSQPMVIPYFEDQVGKDIPGRGTEKPVAKLQQEVGDLLSRLGAFNVLFVSGKFPDGKRMRYGFQITFVYGPNQGRIDCAALPIRAETPRKKDRALAQALYLLRDEMQAMVYAVIHKPGAVPLVPYLIGASGKTVTEELMASGALPVLVPASQAQIPAQSS
jgi:hypothetical protein